MRIQLIFPSLLSGIGNNDVKFKEFLDRVYDQIQVNIQTKIQVHKQVYTDIANILAKVAKYDPCYNFKVQFKGSTYEELKIGNPDEFDFGLVNENWAGKISLLVDASTSPGFGYAVQNVVTCLNKFKIPGTKRLDAGKVRGHLRELVEKAMLELGMKGKIVKRPWEGGPVVTFEILWPGFPFISIDLAISLELPHWPPGARKPPVGIKNPRVQLVPKVKHDPSANPAFWLISFAQVESQIINNIDNDGGCRKKVLQLAKFFKGVSVGRWHPLATYHLKTILLYLNDEKKGPQYAGYWAQGMLVPRFKELIDRLLKHLRSGSLPSFFMPQLDLFEGKTDLASAITGVEDFLKMLKGNPEGLLKA